MQVQVQRCILPDLISFVLPVLTLQQCVLLCQKFFLLRLLQESFLWKAVSATRRKCCRRSFDFVGSDCPAQKCFLRKSSCSAHKCFLRKSSCWFLWSFPIPYSSFIGVLHCQGWSKASFFLVLLYLLIEQRLRKWCEFLMVQKRWFMWPLSEQFWDSQEPCVLEVASWFPENHSFFLYNSEILLFYLTSSITL